MATDRMWNLSPGTLAPNSRVIPSSGWIRRMSVLGRRSRLVRWSNSRNGTCRKVRATSVTLAGRRLPGRPKIGTPAHRQVRLGLAVWSDVVLLAVGEHRLPIDGAGLVLAPYRLVHCLVGCGDVD